MKRVTLFILILFVISFWQISLEAAIINVPSDMSLQEALTECQSNGEDDTINLSPDTYTGNYTFEAEPAEGGLTIIGSGPANTIIDGNKTGRGLWIYNREGTFISLKGIRITNGAISSPYMGAGTMAVTEDDNITIQNCEFTNNNSGDGGGGFGAYIYGNGNIEITDSSCTNNIAENGGGASLLIAQDGNITLSNVTFKDNDSEEFGGGAEAYIFNDGDVQIDECDFEDNESEEEGGGIGIWIINDGNISIEDSIFSGNRAENSTEDIDGGGCLAWIGNIGDINLTGNLFEENHANDDGGGILAQIEDEGEIKLFDNDFVNNEAGDFGGGISAVVSLDGYITLDNNSFGGNQARNSAGSSVSLGGSGTIRLHNNFYERNTANEWAGGLSTFLVGSGETILVNNVFLENSAINEGAGGAYVELREPNGQNIITNNTFYNNDAEMGGGLYIYHGDNGCVTDIYNNIIWGNSATDGEDILLEGGGTVNLYYNNFSDIDLSGFSSTLEQGNNMDEDPLFVSETDLHLQEDSLMIDEGSDSAPEIPDEDKDGNQRISGAAVDLGAYEFTPSAPGGNGKDKGNGGGGGCNSILLPGFLGILIIPILLLNFKK